MLSTFIYPIVRKKKDNLKRHIDARGKMLWLGPPPRIINTSELQIGDVLFCGSSKVDKSTQLIQNLTDGSYVHCGIYIGDNTVVDIVRSGARALPFEKFQEDYCYLAVTRCPGVNRTRQRAIIRYAKLCVKSEVKYNYLGAALLPISEYFYVKSQYKIAFNKPFSPPKISKKFLTKNQMFCSEFIVQCYKACGYIMKNDPYSISHKCSPTWLAEQNIFDLIGYISSYGLQRVDDKDPYLGGCSYMLQKTCSVTSKANY